MPLQVSDLAVSQYVLRDATPARPMALTLDRCLQRDGGAKWAIRTAGDCLDKTGQWVYEPMPSSRDEAFMRACRWDTAEQALVSWLAFGQPDWYGSQETGGPTILYNVRPE